MTGQDIRSRLVTAGREHAKARQRATEAGARLADAVRAGAEQGLTQSEMMRLTGASMRTVRRALGLGA